MSSRVCVRSSGQLYLTTPMQTWNRPAPLHCGMRRRYHHPAAKPSGRRSHRTGSAPRSMSGVCLGRLCPRSVPRSWREAQAMRACEALSEQWCSPRPCNRSLQMGLTNTICVLRKQRTLGLGEIGRLCLVKSIPEELENLVPHVGRGLVKVQVNRLGYLLLEVALR